jgi:hypothetical protein
MENNNSPSPEMPQGGCVCGCIGYGYVPPQTLKCVYDMDNAMSNGTIFPELALDMSEYGTVCKMWGGGMDE